VSIETRRGLGTALAHAVELTAASVRRHDVRDLHGRLDAVRARWPGLDVVIQADQVARQPRRLVAIDMDSTLITVETMNEIARVAGLEEQIAPITARANAGTVDFDQSLRERVALLEGFPEAPLRALAGSTPLTPGAEVLVSTLRRRGHTVAVLSAGFTWFCDDVQSRLSIDRVHSNVLEVAGGRLTGRLVGRIVNAHVKGELLEQLLDEVGLPVDAAVAIGDGANDAVMLARAGLGVAFHGKPPARAAASAILTQASLASVLYLLGMTDDDIDAAAVAPASAAEGRQ